MSADLSRRATKKRVRDAVCKFSGLSAAERGRHIDRIVNDVMAAESRRATVVRIFCPHCERETDADHCADDTLGWYA